MRGDFWRNKKLPAKGSPGVELRTGLSPSSAFAPMPLDSPLTSSPLPSKWRGKYVPCLLVQGGRSTCYCLSQCLACHRLLNMEACIMMWLNTCLSPIFSFKARDEDRGRAEDMSRGRRTRRFLRFIRCHGRREFPVSFPGDCHSHPSFSVYTPDIFHQPVYQSLWLMFHTHKEFSM